MNKEQGIALCYVLRYLHDEQRDYEQAILDLPPDSTERATLEHIHIWHDMRILYEYLLQWRAGWVLFEDKFIDAQLTAYRQWKKAHPVPPDTRSFKQKCRDYFTHLWQQAKAETR